MPSNQPIAEALQDLLGSTTPLDPGSVEYLAVEARQLGADATVQMILRFLAGHPRPTGVHGRNLAEFIRWVAKDPSVQRRLRKSATRLGRCPPDSKGWLRTVVGRLVTRETPVQITGGVQAGSTELDLSASSWGIGQIPSLLDRLSACKPQSGLVKIRFGDFTYASALAIVAQWLIAHGLQTRYELECGAYMRGYLERVGFEDALRDRSRPISKDMMDWAVGLTRVNATMSSDAVTQKIVDIIDTFVQPSADDRRALLILVAEMIENIHRHARIEFDGIAVAQVYPRKLKMGIAFVDSGIGIRESFQQGEPSISIPHDASDLDLLRLACQLHVTSKRRQHSGYGLYLLREVIARNRGTFSLSSGGATLQSFSNGDDAVDSSYRHQSWQGTIVSVVVDLSHRLPIRDVYADMPPPPGYGREDFFHE